jgi:hypothetical protein
MAAGMQDIADYNPHFALRSAQHGSALAWIYQPEFGIASSVHFASLSRNVCGACVIMRQLFFKATPVESRAVFQSATRPGRVSFVGYLGSQAFRTDH